MMEVSRPSSANKVDLPGPVPYEVKYRYNTALVRAGRHVYTARCQLASSDWAFLDFSYGSQCPSRIDSSSTAYVLCMHVCIRTYMHPTGAMTGVAI